MINRAKKRIGQFHHNGDHLRLDSEEPGATGSTGFLGPVSTRRTTAPESGSL
ncbi:hypothetical protein AS9A_0543 [Hoyosella subflava DQS3-9A1]|uniref:Uncharacterized protein n=1 Tax=Hoyosella subflava (strain DSM 45089 / JCM 17490 / NBRC 109087 / DQS3-9A1) TaxID=443218 RepID=F6EIS3_HOYSD|nr:hypothetical protein AS9A_0543 [Hoyosella subflava DQS3-9A1]